MSETDEGGFLGRWARRKAAARRSELQDAETSAAVPEPDLAPAGPEPDAEPEFDLASLPPIESLGPGSDFTVFMRAGVPEELRRMALRRLWVTDPDIRNYKTLADYDWDFNAPGYGQMLPIDDAKRYLTQILGNPGDAEEGQPEPPAAQGGPAEPAAEPVELASPPEDPGEPEVDSAEEPAVAMAPAEPEPQPEPVRRRRRHGGAAPV